MAVAMFFMVSGFVIVMVAQRETQVEFVLKRVLRIFPPLWLSLLLIAIVHPLAPLVGMTPDQRNLNLEHLLAAPDAWANILMSATLANYWFGTPEVNGVAWTLAIEVSFYAMVAVLLPLFKTRPRTALAISAAVLATLQVDDVAHSHKVVFLVAVGSVYVTYLFLGSLVYLRWSGRIGNAFFAVGTVLFAALFLHGVKTMVLQPPYKFSDYGVSYAFGWFAFVALLLVNRHLRIDRVTAFFARISYSLYLNHGSMGLIMISFLYPWFGYGASLVLAFAWVVAISALSYKYVEAPSQRLARRWSAGLRPGGGQVALEPR
jgi:peptidoglycan/LPS O-acetylase OafA/YrhL